MGDDIRHWKGKIFGPVSFIYIPTFIYHHNYSPNKPSIGTRHWWPVSYFLVISINQIIYMEDASFLSTILLFIFESQTKTCLFSDNLERYSIRGRNILCRHIDSLRLSIQATKDEVRYQDLASKYQLTDRSHLPRHPQKRMDSSPDNKNGPYFPVSSTVRSRTRWSIGCWGS